MVWDIEALLATNSVIINNTYYVTLLILRLYWSSMGGTHEIKATHSSKCDQSENPMHVLRSQN